MHLSPMQKAAFLGLEKWFVSKECRKPTSRERHLLYCGYLAGIQADQVGRDIVLDELHAAYVEAMAKAPESLKLRQT